MNYEPLIEGISRMLGSAGKAVEEGGEKGAVAHTPVDVERWLGPLSNPEKQVPVIHDYLRGHAALAEAEATGATHVRDISVPVWQSVQRALQQKVDQDAEVQAALKNMYIGANTPKDPAVKSTVLKPEPLPAEPVSVEVPQETPMEPAKPKKIRTTLTEQQKRDQASAWNDFAVATQEQDSPRIDAALERIKALHPDVEPANPGNTAVQTPGWQKALDYMGGLEQQVQGMAQQRVQSEAWTQALRDFHESSGIDQLELPKHVRDTVTRYEAWADAQKPPSAIDRVSDVLGVPRALMSSVDLSAPGRQGLLMVSRPEYWQSLRPMVESWSPEKYAENQKYIQNHPDFATAQESGLALTDLHDKMSPREEAFQSKLAERIPIMGNLVKSSEQAYTTFLNRLRFDVFTNSLKEAAAAGLDIKDKKFLSDLAEWINTSTGRGGKNLNVGVLGSVLFSPRLAVSRLQTFNPYYYWKLNPFVRTQAIKSNLAAAGLVYGLVTLAGLGGAKVVWDFRNPDAGKVRIGNTRLDFGGGHLQFLRLFAQMATNQKVNSETGKVTELGSKYGVPSRLDVATQFLLSKEAPVPSLVTDWMRGKDMAGNKFNLTNEVISRVTPLAIQDMYDVLKDKGIEGLFYSIPATVGIGMQTYGAKPHLETVPFVGVKGEVPAEMTASYAKAIEQADSTAATMALMKTKNMNPAAAKRVLLAYTKAERLKARISWIKANQEAFRKAKLTGETRIPLTAPPEEQK